MTIQISYSGDPDCDQDASYEVYRDACVRFLSRTVDDCDTKFSRRLGKNGGKITDGCGIYEWSNVPTERFWCGQNIDPYGGWVPLSDDQATNAITRYCDDDLSLDPKYDSDGTFHQFQLPGTSYDNIIDGKLVVRMTANWNLDSGTKNPCATRQAFSTKGDECVRKLQAVQNKCGGQGRGVVDDTTRGCVAWQMWGQQL